MRRSHETPLQSERTPPEDFRHSGDFTIALENRIPNGKLSPYPCSVSARIAKRFSSSPTLVFACLPLIAFNAAPISLRAAERLPSAGPVTFYKDVAPIVFQNCAVCHRPGQAAPFSLIEYADVRKRAKDIASQNKVAGQPLILQDSDIELGTWDSANQKFTVFSAANESNATAMPPRAVTTVILPL